MNVVNLNREVEEEKEENKMAEPREILLEVDFSDTT